MFPVTCTNYNTAIRFVPFYSIGFHMSTISEITEHYVARQEGGRVYYYKLGRGTPLVFVPGGSGRSFRNVTHNFATHFTCYVLDLPGADRSDLPRSWIATKNWTVPHYTRAILEVLDHRGIQQCGLIGDHTGAMIALDIAANHPGRVQRLVLDSLPYWDLRKSQIVWESSYKHQYTDVDSYDVPVSSLLPSLERMKETEPDLTLEEWQVRDELIRRDRRWHYVHMYANSHFDTEALGPKVRAPTLLIYGEREVRRRGELHALNGIKGSILEVVEDSPKKGVATGGSHRFQPDKFSNLALNFLLKS